MTPHGIVSNMYYMYAEALYYTEKFTTSADSTLSLKKLNLAMSRYVHQTGSIQYLPAGNVLHPTHCQSPQ